MEALKVLSFSSFYTPKAKTFHKPRNIFLPTSHFLSSNKTNSPKTSKLFTKLSETVQHHEPQLEVGAAAEGEEKFAWFEDWYPVMPVCDLDNGVPHAKKIWGLSAQAYTPETCIAFSYTSSFGCAYM